MMNNNFATPDYRKILVKHLRSIRFTMPHSKKTPTKRIPSILAGVVGAIGLFLSGCGAGDEQGLMMSTIASATGSTVTLAWDPVTDPTVVGYYIHYGKQSPNQWGSCSYDHEQFVPSSQGTVMDLDPGSIYYFAVSAYNGLQSACSNEVQTAT